MAWILFPWNGEKNQPCDLDLDGFQLPTWEWMSWEASKMKETCWLRRRKEIKARVQKKSKNIICTYKIDIVWIYEERERYKSDEC